jgi:serine/threonine-protein phosphatase 2A regulatory subunit B''
VEQLSKSSAAEGEKKGTEGISGPSTAAKDTDKKESKPAKEASWVAKLRSFNESKAHKSAAENDREADVEFLKLLEEEKQSEEERNPSFKTIPRFFFKKPTSENSLFLRVRQEARTRFLQNKTAEVLEKEDLETLWYLLKEHLS